MALLEASGIGKNFGETKVLKDISLNLEQGEALAIIGSSGSGKTTLLRCLNFLERPDTGIFKVTLLQVVKRILAPMGNEVITLVKDTSLANTIANKEIIMMAKEYSAKGLIWPLFSTAIFFLVFVGALTLLFGWAEKKLDYFR